MPHTLFYENDYSQEKIIMLYTWMEEYFAERAREIASSRRPISVGCSLKALATEVSPLSRKLEDLARREPERYENGIWEVHPFMSLDVGDRNSA